MALVLSMTDCNHSSVKNATIVQSVCANIFCMDEYKDRLLSAMKRVNMTTQQLADKIGISYQAVKKVIDGKSAGFGIINNVRAAAALNVNSDWLATGEGRMEIDDVNTSHPAKPLRWGFFSSKGFR